MSNAQEGHVSVDELRKQSGVRWLRDSPYLYFVGNDAATFRQLETALKRIESTRTGQILINCIDAAARRKQERLDIVLNSTRLGVIANNSADSENGRGTGSELHCNFKEAEWMDGSSSAKDEVDFIASVLFHELVHVLHNLTGERVRITPCDKEIPKWPELLHEEARTVGLGAFSGEELSETEHRADERRAEPSRDVPEQAMRTTSRRTSLTVYHPDGSKSEAVTYKQAQPIPDIVHEQETARATASARASAGEQTIELPREGGITEASSTHAAGENTLDQIGPRASQHQENIALSSEINNPTLHAENSKTDTPLTADELNSEMTISHEIQFDQDSLISAFEKSNPDAPEIHGLCAGLTNFYMGIEKYNAGESANVLWQLNLLSKRILNGCASNPEKSTFNETVDKLKKIQEKETIGKRRVLISKSDFSSIIEDNSIVSEINDLMPNGKYILKISVDNNGSHDVAIEKIASGKFNFFDSNFGLSRNLNFSQILSDITSKYGNNFSSLSGYERSKNGISLNIENETLTHQIIDAIKNISWAT
ncbi:M91 family zinc metallopeptidase [Burkholderia cepacia]|uniref:M91 family zinc metallopeptidase n=1 Tax=Burkholderia cepacia TaxID=292 RepID=UPI0018C8B516|nr:M91 family zinc metallopeptidase [Burkholderia cepacia]